jgi:exodeoxyribonuclease VII large subunit
MSLGRRLETARRELTLLTMRRPFSDTTEMITTRAQQVDVLFEDLKDAAARRVETSAQHLKQVHASLEALSPLAVLKRGYAVVRKLPEEKVVRSVKQLASRDRAKLIFADGAVTAEIAEVEPTEHPK